MLRNRFTPGASTENTATGWLLQTPAGAAGNYRLAQLDNYANLSREGFPHKQPASLSLRCRVSCADLPGTWGFGFWNDPFAFSLGMRGGERRLPALPNACWFFNASSENHLSFHNKLPAQGFLTQTFRSPKIPSILLLPGLTGAPLLLSKTLSRWLRNIVASIIAQDGATVNVDTTLWHTYNLNWRSKEVVFSIDQSVVFKTPISPIGPLGAILWIDNQYAAWTPSGKIGMGTLETLTTGWIEIDQLEISS